jgi:hypothetical protein
MSIQEHIRKQVSSPTFMAVLATLLLALGCGQEATAPEDFGTASFVIVSGNGQSGVVGTELPQALVVKATKSNGQGLSGVTVTFRVTSGGGSVFAGAATTGSNGIAQDYWTLGTSTAQLQQLEVRAVLSTGQKQVYGVFTATPLAAAAAQVAIQAGDGQSASASAPVPIAPAVFVSDQYANPVPGVSVAFAVTAGGGSITGGVTTTNASGIATVGTWTLGPALGANTLTATASGSGITGNPVTFAATAVVPSNTWTTKASMPTARHDLGIGIIDGILYAVGGRNRAPGSPNVDLATVEAYDPAVNAWTTRASMLIERDGMGVAVLNGLLYAAAGDCPADVCADNDADYLDAYDPTTDSWTSRAPLLGRRYQLGLVALDGLLYAVGGRDSDGPVTRVEAYDPATDEWTERAPMPTGRHNLGVAVIDGIVYAVGGVVGGLASATLEAYDPVTDEWTPKTSMPTARWGLSVAAIDGRLYAIGGSTGPGTVVATVEVYDPTTDTWTPRAPMPTPRELLDVGVITGILYAVGGRNLAQESFATVEAYQP